jgi:hypothetical protein
MEPRIKVTTASLYQDDMSIGVFAQSGRENAAGRPPADHDVVGHNGIVRLHSHQPLTAPAVSPAMR